MQFSFTFLTDSTVLGLEYRNLSKIFSNCSADTEGDNRTKYVYFISITENKIEEKSILLFCDYSSICFISGYLTV